MNNFKKKKYRFWHSPLFLLIILGLMLFFGYKMIDLFEKKNETFEKKEFVLNRIDGLEQRKIIKEKDILKLETEEGKEELIREKYQMVKENEKLVTIVEENIVDLDKKINETKQKGFLNWIKDVFKK